MATPTHAHTSHCSGCCGQLGRWAMSRRQFIGGVSGTAATTWALGGLSWPLVAAELSDVPKPPAREPLIVKPILTYATPKRREQTSWRSWGGIETEEDANQEKKRIEKEIGQIRSAAEFPIQVRPVALVKSPQDFMALSDVADADVLLLYAAGGSTDLLNAIADFRKQTVVFLRHQSGPVYLWYEIISPRFLRQHTDRLADVGVAYEDVVVDKTDEVLWRLRALCGLKNMVGKPIVAVGGASGWGPEGRDAPDLAKQRWELGIRSVSYAELGELIQAARQDDAAVRRASERADAFLKASHVTLDTKRIFVDNAFLLEEIFRQLMERAGARAMTINECMGTIMPLSETTACLPLMTLNDAGYLAFCESDFVVIPSGMLLAAISGLPVFLNDPTYPHDGLITLAHCTAPSKMNGTKSDPVRVMTHFESDYGAAPKVDMRIGQEVTMIIPDFDAELWVGLAGEIVGHPLMPICRSQIEVRYDANSEQVAERMRGFHWMLGYGNYVREVGYAVKKTGVGWELLA